MMSPAEADAEIVGSLKPSPERALASSLTPHGRSRNNLPTEARPASASLPRDTRSAGSQQKDCPKLTETARPEQVGSAASVDAIRYRVDD